MCHASFQNESYNRVLKKVSKDEGLDEISLDIREGTSKGDNYIGCVYRVKAQGKRGSEQVVLSLILKTSANGSVRDSVPFELAYKRENYFYSTVVQELKDVQNEVVVDPGCKFSFVKCYHTSDTYMEEMLVLEDLKAQGFVMYNRLKSTDYTNTSLVMMALAKFHALSYVLKVKKPRVFEDIASKCPDILWNGPMGKSFERIFMSSSEMFLSIIKDPSNKTRVKKYIEDISEKMHAVTAIAGQYGVLGHGDCWVNNVLFKYMDGVPVDTRLLDFQLLRYSSPTLDILYFIFCCTDQEFRNKHYYSMLDLYHHTLSACLREQGLEIDDFMTKKSFLQEIKNFSDYGLGMAILTLRTFCSDAEDAPDFTALAGNKDEIKISLPTGDGYNRYVESVNGVVSDYVKYGYLE